MDFFVEQITICSVMISLLGSPNYHMRDAAHCALSKQLDYRILLFKNEDDAEIKLRLRHLQEKYRWDRAERWYQQNKDEKLPWIHDEESYKYLNHPLNTLKDDQDKNLWPRWRRATALYIRDKMADGLDSDGVGRIIQYMAQAETDWLKYRPQMESGNEYKP